MSDSKFGVWCEVWGGVTGHRASWLKSNESEVQLFETYAAAEAEAQKYNQRARQPTQQASFSYRVKEFD